MCRNVQVCKKRTDIHRKLVKCAAICAKWATQILRKKTLPITKERRTVEMGVLTFLLTLLWGLVNVFYQGIIVSYLEHFTALFADLYTFSIFCIFSTFEYFFQILHIFAYFAQVHIVHFVEHFFEIYQHI